MSCVRLALGLMLFGLAAFQAAAQAHPAPTRVGLADGVHLFRTAPYGEVGLDGNAVVIASRSSGSGTHCRR